jgi:hypothetical protein
MSNEQVTERGQRVLEHLQRAHELKPGFAEYTREAGVAMSEIYSGKQSLVRKGVIPGRVRADDPEHEEMRAGRFVAVHVAPRFEGGSTLACQIRHPSEVAVESGRACRRRRGSARCSAKRAMFLPQRRHLRALDERRA